MFSFFDVFLSIFHFLIIFLILFMFDGFCSIFRLDMFSSCSSKKIMFVLS